MGLSRTRRTCAQPKKPKYDEPQIFFCSHFRMRPRRCSISTANTVRIGQLVRTMRSGRCHKTLSRREIIVNRLVPTDDRCFRSFVIPLPAAEGPLDTSASGLRRTLNPLSYLPPLTVAERSALWDRNTTLDVLCGCPGPSVPSLCPVLGFSGERSAAERYR